MEKSTQLITMSESQINLYRIFLENPIDIFSKAMLKRMLAPTEIASGGFADHQEKILQWLCDIGAVKAEPYYGHTVYSLAKPVNYKQFTYSWEWGNPLTIYEELYVNGDFVEKKKYEGEFLNEL